MQATPDTREMTLAGLNLPAWIADDDRTRDAEDHLYAALNSAGESVSLSWCKRRLRKLRKRTAMERAADIRAIAYPDPTGEHAVNRVTYGGGAR